MRALTQLRLISLTVAVYGIGFWILIYKCHAEWHAWTPIAGIVLYGGGWLRGAQGAAAKREQV